MLKMGPMGTQTAVIEVPTNEIRSSLEDVRFRVGLTVVRFRILPKLVRCFSCHQLGHLARDCQIPKEGGETCRRCGMTGHQIDKCGNPPKCIICTRDGTTGVKAAHVTASLACPANKSRPGTEPKVAKRKTVNNGIKSNSNKPK